MTTIAWVGVSVLIAVICLVVGIKIGRNNPNGVNINTKL